MSIELERKIYLRREFENFILSFRFDENLIKKIKHIPYSRYDNERKVWVVRITKESLETLNRWFKEEGITDVYPETLIHEGENVEPAPLAILKEGSGKKPYFVYLGYRSDDSLMEENFSFYEKIKNLYNRLSSLPGAEWSRNAQAMTYPSYSRMAIKEMVERNIISDPEGVLSTSRIIISYDGRYGKFVVDGDKRADKVFQSHFPERDLMKYWREKGIECEFSDELTEEIYYGELARKGDSLNLDLKIPLFKYQEDAVRIAVKRSGFAIFDAPGVGKTPQAIAWGKYLLEKGEGERCIIVTPGAVKTQFSREIKRFTGDNDVVVIEGDKKERKKRYIAAKEARWVILNYDLLSLDFKEIQPLVNNQLLIADEVHKIKSRASKRGKAMRDLAKKAHKKLALSGTPIENDPKEWYTIMNGFVVPGIFGNAIEFFNRYSYPGRFGGFEGARNIKELRERSKPHYIRRKKKDVATHLPELMVKNLVLDPDEKLTQALKRIHKDAKEEIKRGKLNKNENLDLFDDELDSSSAMTAMLMLRLICSSPRLIHMSDSPSARTLCESGVVPNEDGPKLDELRSIALEMQLNNERLVVFTAFRKMADLIAERFKEDKIRFVTYTGSSTSKERENSVASFIEEFNGENNGPTVFLATDAASEGLNLGKMCSTLINFDLSYKPSTMIQRGNRIHRVDGDVNKSYNVINLTIAKTVEEGIIELIGQKADLSDAILGEEGSRKETTGRKSGSKSREYRNRIEGNMFEKSLEGWEYE